ncbi:hypothetical protein H6G89_18215 [Oscillatoria sp. FACHB-1407]|uniref:hypothetical protein n=1 Tax=Oscillatoria sp. FACHB-1407 TaxID=2692847 RepID=UPI00168766E3|nr:hypothetical protein [Oscillatoria sp. FACHB-1407]MBD2462978.1 hypothetical protein [Oscillatoria sp. FACHB-1407]
MKTKFWMGLTATGLLIASGALSNTSSNSVLAQQVVEQTPAVNSQNVSPDTSIAGEFESNPAVDPSSVRIFVNGQDVTSRSTITRSFFTYRPDQPLPVGQVQVQVQYRNVRGEQRTANWAFNVQQPQLVRITSVTHNAVGTTQAAGSTLTVTINGTPGSEASVLLIQDGRTVREVAAQERSSGVYVANISVRSGERVSEGAVVGRLRRQNQTTYAVASQPFAWGDTPTTGQTPSTGNTGNTGNTGSSTVTDLKPRFTSHQDGDRVNQGFTLVGQTRPNASVRVNVVARVSVLGVDLGNIGSDTLVDRDIRANSQGEFRVQVPRPRIPVPGTEYTVRATARLDNVTSEPTEIRLRQQ